MSASDDMEARLQPLIEERAPWLFSGRPHHNLARKLLMRLLGYPETIRLGTEYRDLPSAEILLRVSDKIIRNISIDGLENIPASGPALIVANHPTGIADGIVLHALVSSIRDDLFIYANQDITRVLPQLDSIIAPVEWRVEKRSHAKTRATMDYTRTALENGRIGLIFPSGRLAKRRGITLHERPWMASAAMIARKFGAPVIPLRIRARNSLLFYLLDAMHPTIRDITLFYEVLNKASQTYRVTIAPAIDPATLPQKSEEGILTLREAVLSLPEPAATPAPLSRLGRPQSGYKIVAG